MLCFIKKSKVTYSQCCTICTVCTLFSEDYNKSYYLCPSLTETLQSYRLQVFDTIHPSFLMGHWWPLVKSPL